MTSYLIHRQDKTTGKSQLVAKYSTHCKQEAQLAWETLNYVAQATEHNKYYPQFVYSFTEELTSPRYAPPIDLQVDLTQAKPTKRPITYSLSYRIEHDRRIYLAHHIKYGTIRGQCEDHAAGGRLFIARVQTVWPNSCLERK